MKTPLSMLAVCAVLGLSTAAHAGWFGGTDGDGKKVTESRDVKDFKRINVKGPYDVTVRHGDAFSVRVTTDSNLQPILKTRVEGDALIITTEKQGVSTRGKNLVEVVMPDFRGIHINGSGDADISGFGAERDLDLSVNGSGDIAFEGGAHNVAVSVNGSGDVSLRGGSASQLSVEVNGSGDVDARKLAVHDAKVAVAGSGDVSLTVNGGTLNAAVNGSGDVTWEGDGKLASSVKRGSGDIQHR